MLECWKIKFFSTLAVNPMKKHVAGTDIWTKLELLKSAPPALYMFRSAAPHDQSKLILTCLATGFHPKHIEMNVTQNNVTLQPFSSTGVRPNDNQTFQMRTSVEINRDEKRVMSVTSFTAARLL
ncbi:HLA class I histocompatibility B-13 alpha chain [Labeo rohita]|uniref:HLA class I histocompatibility B-13 alpha chain n=1 Tax=Labeo rohita TaxID=84645 RepID=A0A498LUJ6_LABRO|nr:HLA class I histocompatibility B-13 alpha chain [Labeo rohita]